MIHDGGDNVGSYHALWEELMFIFVVVTDLSVQSLAWLLKWQSGLVQFLGLFQSLLELGHSRLFHRFEPLFRISHCL